MPSYPFRILPVLFWAVASIAQNGNVPGNVPQASRLVESALAASGGRAALASVQDLHESGVITYNWGTSPLHGTAAISSIGTSDFRFDINIPGQDRSWYVTRGQGKSRENGKSVRLPYHAGANRASLSLPILRLATAAASSGYKLSYIGKETRDQQELYQIRIERIASGKDPEESAFAALETVDYFLDPASFLIVRTEDVAHPANNMNVSQRHRLEYSDYKTVNGVQVPFLIVEHIENAQTWSLELTEANFNVGLTRSDIQF